MSNSKDYITKNIKHLVVKLLVFIVLLLLLTAGFRSVDIIVQNQMALSQLENTNASLFYVTGGLEKLRTFVKFGLALVMLICMFPNVRDIVDELGKLEDNKTEGDFNNEEI